jgi:hypothetical protein
MTRTVPVVLLLALASCAHDKAWVASGTSIAMLGESFVATGRLMDSALDSKAVTAEQYRKWAAFAHYFKPAYDLAADRWLHADDSATEHAAVVLTALAGELAAWTALATAQKGGG